MSDESSRTAGRCRLRRAVLGVLAGLPVAAAGLAWHLGWYQVRSSGASPWREATGWRRIEPADRPGPPRTRFDLEGPEPLTLHWLGHSGFLLEWRDTRLLLDPNTGERCSLAPRLLHPRPDPATFGRIDAALLSHAHYDHLDLPTLRAVPDLERVVVPAGSEGYLSGLGAPGGRPKGGAPRVIGLAPGGSVTVGSLEVVAVPARHNGGRHHPLASRHRAAGYVIRAAETAVYFAGDTGYAEHFTAIGRTFRPRLAILPIGAFSPAVPIGLYHLSPEQAVAAADDLGSPLVVPCHFGTFVLSLDGAATALPRFARAARRSGVRWAMPGLWTGEG